MHRFVKILLLSATVMLLFLMCTACLETEDEVKAEHSLVYREAVAADCVSEGNTEYWYCTDCGKYFSDEAATTEISLNDTVIAKSAHKTVLNSEISATCSNDGQRAYYKCTVCNEKFNDENGENKITDESSLVLPATGIHISVHHNAVPSTCKELGTKEYWSCSTCDGIFSDEQCTQSTDLAAISETVFAPHSLSEIPEQPGSCNTPGKMKHYECDECNKLFKDSAGLQPIIDENELNTPLNPSRHNATIVEGYDATCYTPGQKDYWICNDCGNMFADETCQTSVTFQDIFIPTGVHRLVYHAPVNANCSQSGQKEHWSCDFCGNYFADESGLYQIYDIFVPQDYTRHDKLSHFDRIEPTCIEDGLSEHYFCNDCQTYFDIYMTPQSYSYLVVRKNTAFHSVEFIAQREPSCLIGISTNCYQCIHCNGYFSDPSAYIGSELDKNTVEIPANGVHNLQYHKAVTATCEASGNKQYWSCSACNKMFLDEQCTNETDADEVFSAQLEHKIVYFSETDSTCSEHGYYEHYSCELCHKLFSDGEGLNEISKNDVLKALEPHPHLSTWKFDSNGHWHPVTCDCPAAVVDYANHSYEPVYPDVPMCVFVGDLVFACEVCNHERIQHVTTPILSHNMVYVEAVPATCTQSGLSDYYYCSICKQNYLLENGEYVKGEPQVINNLGHSYVWTTIVPTTCQQDGKSEGVCSRCGDLVERTHVKYEHASSLELEYNSVSHRNVCSYCKEPVTAPEMHTTGENHDYCATCNTSLTVNHNNQPYTDSSLLRYELLENDTYEIVGLDSSFTGKLIINGIYNGKFVSSISDTALKDNRNITYIAFPASLTYIGDCSGCYSLESVSFEESIQLEKICSFANSKLTDVVIPESVTTIGYRAFYNCYLEEITLPANVERIEDYAFARSDSSSNLLSIVIPDSCTYIGAYAFQRVATDDVDFGENVEYIGEYAFAYNYISTLRLPDSLTFMGEGAFFNGEIRHIYLGTGLKTIPAKAFAYNISMNVSIYWGESEIVSIGEMAFYNNFGLGSDLYGNTVIIPATVKEIGANAFGTSYGIQHATDIRFESPEGWYAGDTLIENANKIETVESEGELYTIYIYFAYADRVWTKP